MTDQGRRALSAGKRCQLANVVSWQTLIAPVPPYACLAIQKLQ